jgi:hypothetical protein
MHRMLKRGLADRAPSLRYHARAENILRSKLVAVVIAGLLNVPIARAQDASVTLYGRLNVSWSWSTASNRAGCPTNVPIRTSTAYLQLVGIRNPRRRALGHGISAIFQIENSISVTQGTASSPAATRIVGFYGRSAASRWATSSGRTTTSCRSSATCRR